MFFGGERRRGLSDLVEPLQLGLDLLAEVRAFAEPSEQRGVDLAGGGDLAGGHGRGGEVFGKARGEFFLVVLTEPLHELAEPPESQVELAGVGAGHRLDDLSECLDRPVGVGLEVLTGELFDFAEPIVFDGLVEKGCVGLVAVVGFGVFLEVLGELADERAIVAGLDFGDAGRRSSGAAVDEANAMQRRSCILGFMVMSSKQVSATGDGVDCTATSDESGARSAMPAAVGGLRWSGQGFLDQLAPLVAAELSFVVGDEGGAGALAHAAGEARVRGQQLE